MAPSLRSVTLGILSVPAVIVRVSWVFGVVVSDAFARL